MARKCLSTRTLSLKDDLASSAISTEATSFAPWFVSIDSSDLIVSGFHIGRRRDWADEGRRELVWLDVQEENGVWFYSVWRCGTNKPEHVSDWDMAFRVGGLRSMPEELLELQAIAVH